MFGGISNFQGSILHAYKQKHQDGSVCIYGVCYQHHTAETSINLLAIDIVYLQMQIASYNLNKCMHVDKVV